MDQFYEMIYKRKSVRRYDGKRPLSAVELAEITAQLEKLFGVLLIFTGIRELFYRDRKPK